MISIYRLLSPLAIWIYGMLAKTLLTGKLRETWRIRWIEEGSRPVHAYRKINRDAFSGPPVWIHAASGEFEYAKSVIRELVARGEKNIVVSYFSPTYSVNVQKFPGVTAAFPLPFDRLDWMLELVSWLSPRCLLIARTDAWPMLVFACKQRHVPMLLFSATFHAGSRRMSALARALTASTLSMIDDIHCVSEDDLSLLRTLSAANIRVSGDSRYDQVLARLENPKPIPEALRAALHPKVFVAGSVWDEDVAAVLAAAENQNASTILVPHEPTEDHLSFIEKHLKTRKGVSYSRLSSLLKKDHIQTVALDYIIVDSVGFLAELYTLGQIAFVGGSFRGSVHSVMEPLAAGCVTLVGPDHRNNREAIEFQSVVIAADDCSAVLAAQNGDDLRMKFTQAAIAIQSTPSIKAQIKAEVQNRGGATRTVVEWVHTHPARRQA